MVQGSRTWRGWGRGWVGVVVALLLGSAALSVVAGCRTNPVTGRSQFNALSREEEIRIGEESMPELIEGYGGEVPLAGPRGYVEEVGWSMAEETELDYPSLPWEFVLLDSEVINAFALPGGKVFVSRGLVERMESEAQLAGVLGHEIGHVTAQHADDMITRQMVLSGIAVAGAVVAGTSEEEAVQIGAAAVVGASGLFALSFDRDQELEADRLGVRYMTRAGYSPTGLMGVMEILKEAAAGRGTPEFLSTHPLPETRIRKLEKKIAQKRANTAGFDKLRVGEAEFERRMLGPLRDLAASRGDSLGGALASIGRAEAWCLHCAVAGRGVRQGD